MVSRSDLSNGYDALAQVFVRARNQRIGPETVRKWSGLLASDAVILDVACGFGEPITKVLVEQRFDVYAIDASVRMVEAFQARFPQVPVACEAAEESSFFGRTFDGIVCWGLIFLLLPEMQSRVIAKLAKALKPGGRLLFTVSRKPARWNDAMTEMQSESLGEAEYIRLLAENGLELEGFDCDEGENDYLFARRPSCKPSTAPPAPTGS